MALEFLVKKLQQSLGFDDVHSIAEYCNGFEDGDMSELAMYLMGLLDNDAAVDDIVSGLVAVRLSLRRRDPVQTIQPTSVTKPKAKSQEVKTTSNTRKPKKSVEIAHNNTSSSTTSQDTRYTAEQFYQPGIHPLSSPPPSSACMCMGTRHSPLTNCTSCGFILCSSSSSSSSCTSCPICHSRLLPPRISLSQAIANNYPSSCHRAYEMKDMLLKFDAAGATNSSSIIDSEAMWQDSKRHQEEEEEEVSLSSQLDMTRLDFAGRIVK